MARFILRLSLSLIMCVAPLTSTQAQSTMFDLTGPTLTVTVTRGETTLPLAQVPALQPGDKLTLRANLPEDQSARYLLIVGFLRGATNPPPKDWFVEAETWKPKKSTLSVEIPEGAEQAIAFLAPETGGGRNAVISGVRGKPGVFLRATQDLYQASLDRARLETFIAGIAALDEAAPERLGQVSPVLANSLGIKLDAECLKHPRAQQAACLTQNRERMVLQINRGATLTETLTGAPADVAYRIAATREAGAGYYSPYIGLARDLAKLFGAFRTAQYQYLPALAIGRGDETRLQLNEAPSFQNPRSVLVVPMPPIGPAMPPVLRPRAKGMMCLNRPDLELPIEGAALFYATSYAGDLSLRIRTEDGGTTDLPLSPDPARGAFVVTAPGDRKPTERVSEAMLHGRWGFDDFEGPSVHVQTVAPASWKAEQTNVVVGREQPLVLRGEGAACIEKVELRDAAGALRGLTWKANSAQDVTVTLPLEDMAPGSLTLLVSHYGAENPTVLPLKALREASRLDGFLLHAGDKAGVLSGARLDQVAHLQIGEARFTPGHLARAKGGDRLELASEAPITAQPGEAQARVTMRDGRTANVRATIATARPSAVVVDRNVSMPAVPDALALELPEDIVPPAARLTFSLRYAKGGIGAQDAIEIATADGTASHRLSVADGELQRIGTDVAVATIEPQALLGAGAVGEIRFRPSRGDVSGDWQPLVRIVRLPAVERVACPSEGGDCRLEGRDLFVIAAIADDALFARPVTVPDGFVGTSLSLPRPQGDSLYLRLHDAPESVVRLRLADRP
ncbi:hypothetical protein [Sphingobium lignivorans]|uniref:Uncharacterized protein n=1 Tax=Sphingobium lignivorans TaxID=2735886 RepID=A0ABR6NF19_9SPHN|nr:hypothetical protein [Sphingobium lignivorans]MBB5985877.1 hypothetical protein [Sphingobium lignivorans]